MTYYMGSTGGGVWKTTDAGMTWKNISDGSIQSGSVGAIAVAPNDANVLYVGMGEHAVRGVMTSHGDGVYKSTDAGKTWQNVGLPDSRHIAAIRIHPDDHNLVYVAVQGAVYTPTKKRGVYRSQDGGTTWQQVLFINETTGAADLSIDPNNPRILYAGMWDHQRTPWSVRSGGPGSGIHQSKDGGTTWTKLSKGLPAQMGKVAVDVSAANPQIVYANIEAKKGGVFRSDDGGGSWKQVNSERTTVARAWYYIEVFADRKTRTKFMCSMRPFLNRSMGARRSRMCRWPIPTNTICGSTRMIHAISPWPMTGAPASPLMGANPGPPKTTNRPPNSTGSSRTTSFPIDCTPDNRTTRPSALPADPPRNDWPAGLVPHGGRRKRLPRFRSGPARCRLRDDDPGDDRQTYPGHRRAEVGDGPPPVEFGYLAQRPEVPV